MKTLSIKQPWASLICEGIKDIENRTWHTKFRGRILIHSSQKAIEMVFGNEVFGVAQEAVALCDGCIEIPQLGTKHSLNISVSAGIVVWDLFQKMHFAK